MTTGTYLSKINTVTFSYGYFQKKTKKNMHFGKKKKPMPVNHLNAILN